MYTDFLEQKQRKIQSKGFKASTLPSILFDHQKYCVKWALEKGQAAIFADTGLGKALMELAWAKQVAKHTNGKVLILAPLAVAKQIEQEGNEHFSIPVRYCRSQDEADTAEESIICTNYDMLHKFDAAKFTGVALDESSCLKAFTGKTCTQIIEMFADTSYKLAASATPSPNDFVELGTHAEFLGIMNRTEMLATFFTHDSGSTQTWRLKGHAEDRFWKWVCSWALMVRKPSDINRAFDDERYNLPPLHYHSHVVESGRHDTAQEQGALFATEASTLTEQRAARKASLRDRVNTAASLVNNSDEHWIVWCDLNAESTALTKAIPGAVEVHGGMKREEKEQAMMDFANGFIRVLVTKPSICGWGMNFQICNNMAFVGLSNSFEQIYQATRRCWRFGQVKPVNAHFIYAVDEGAVIRNIQRKEKDFKRMQDQMAKNMQHATDSALFQTTYERKVESGVNWTAYQGDCVEVMQQEIADNSIGFSVFSPPFSSLYTYSASDRDMGNSRSDEEFYEHFKFAVDEFHRVMMPGRIMAVHCTQIPAMKERDGYIGIKDFRGDLIRLFQEKGFIFHSEVTIWKDPVVEMQRTKALGLLHKQTKKDSAMSRQGLPDYLVMFRKIGDNPEPVTKTNESFPIPVWQKYASPVWFDVDQTRTLQREKAREYRDERHVCLAKDSLVLTHDKGYIPIQDVELGDLVLTHKGRWMPVIAKRKTSDAANVVKIKAAGVHDLTVTPTHKLWAKSGKGVVKAKNKAQKANAEWIEAQNLDGCYINLKLPPVEDSELTEQEWWIVGRWLADGHLHNGTEGRTSIHISGGNHKLDHLMQNLGSYAGTKHSTGSTCTQIRIKDPDKKLRDVIYQCGKYAHEKQMPRQAYSLPKHLAKSLLDGYLSGDGHYSVDRDRWSASSTSKRLLLGMQFLIQRVHGVTATLHPGKTEGQSLIQGRIVNTKQEWVLTFQSHGYSFSFVDSEGSWKKVKCIEPQSEMVETWNIQVLEDASYTAEGCIVKNCPLQLDTIERAIELWSNPGDLVLSPFMGIGSEGYCALRMNRKFVGIELKPSYYNIAVKNLHGAGQQLNLLDLLAVAS